MLHAIGVASGESLIIRAGAVAAALVTLTMAIRMTTKFAVKQLTKAIHNELGGKIEKVYENTLELRPNGGSTVADAVRRLEANQLQVMVEQQGQRHELRLQRELIEGQHTALVDHLSDHKNLPKG